MGNMQLSCAFLLISLSCLFCASAEILREEALVTISHRQRRSLEPEYKVQIRAFGQDHNLHLRRPRRSTIFADNFSLKTVDTDKKGNIIFTDKTPSKQELKEAENGIYTDPNSNCAVKILHEKNGNIKMSGILDKMVITNENGKHVATKSDDSNHSKSQRERNTNDYVDLNRTITQSHQPRTSNGLPIQTRQITTAQAEVAIVFDNQNYNNFKGNNTAMVNYLGLLFHSINNRYASVKDPLINFVVSGLTATASKTAEPYITSSVTSSGNTYDISKMLDKFSSWGYANSANLEKHDLLALITGVKVQMKDSQGNYVDGVAGLAYLRAACWVDAKNKKDLGASVSQDNGGYFTGVSTIAHELAHNLGAPHDGQSTGDTSDTSSCPWSQGYLMSYEGYGKKSKFYFSSCSIAQMKSFVSSDSAKCLKSLQSSSQWIPTKNNAGDHFNMTVQCQKSLNRTTAYVDTTKDPNELCKNLACKYPDSSNPSSIWSVSLNNMPADYSACGTSGSCVEGDCVVQSSFDSQCQTATSKPTAYADKTKSQSQLCENLSCQYANTSNPNVVYTITLNRRAVDYTPCGNNGRCIDSQCDEPVIAIPPDMNEQCKTGTGSSGAVVIPNKSADELCSNLSCRYPDEDDPDMYWTMTLNRRPQDYTPCGSNGNCLNGQCKTGIVTSSSG